MKKISHSLIGIFILLAILLNLSYPHVFKDAIFNCLDLWLRVVVVSIVPMYILSNLAYNYRIFSKIFYPLFGKILNLNNSSSFSLFFTSIITGNPTSTILVTNARKYNHINANEANRLLKFSVFLTPLFILNLVDTKIAWMIIIVQIVVSLIICRITNSDQVNTNIEIKKIIKYDEILERTPMILLNILMTMIIVSLFKSVVLMIISPMGLDNFLPIRFLLDCLEITTGAQSVLTYDINYYVKIFLLTFLISFNGVAIILQCMPHIKKTSLNMTSFILYRLIIGIISSLFVTILVFLF